MSHEPSLLQRQLVGRVLTAWRADQSYYRAQSSGERVTLASLYPAVLARRPWRGKAGQANAAYEYRPSDEFLRALGGADAASVPAPDPAPDAAPEGEKTP